jgi:hypothetical protein
MANIFIDLDKIRIPIIFIYYFIQFLIKLLEIKINKYAD